MRGGKDEAAGENESIKGSPEEEERQEKFTEVKGRKKVFHLRGVCSYRRVNAAIHCLRPQLVLPRWILPGLSYQIPQGKSLATPT